MRTRTIAVNGQTIELLDVRNAAVLESWRHQDLIEFQRPFHEADGLGTDVARTLWDHVVTRPKFDAMIPSDTPAASALSTIRDVVAPTIIPIIGRAVINPVFPQAPNSHRLSLNFANTRSFADLLENPVSALITSKDWHSQFIQVIRYIGQLDYQTGRDIAVLRGGGLVVRNVRRAGFPVIAGSDEFSDYRPYIPDFRRGTGRRATPDSPRLMFLPIWVRHRAIHPEN